MDLFTLMFIIFPWAGVTFTGYGFAWISVHLFHHSALVSTLCFLVVPLTIKAVIAVRKRSYESDDVGCCCGFIAILYFFILGSIVVKLVHKHERALHRPHKSLTMPTDRH